MFKQLREFGLQRGPSDHHSDDGGDFEASQSTANDYADGLIIDHGMFCSVFR